MGGEKSRADAWQVSGMCGCFIHRLIVGYVAMTGNPHENGMVDQGVGFEMAEMEARESGNYEKDLGCG